MTRSLAIKFGITILALGLLAVLRGLKLETNPTDWGLVVIAFLPWLAYVHDSAELPGGWKVKFREMKDEADRQRAEIESMKFLISHFVTDDEAKHLNKIANGDLFPFVRSDETPFFEQELRRLRSYRLIEGQPGKGIRTLEKEGGDVKSHFRVTSRGRDYLKLRAEMEEGER